MRLWGPHALGIQDLVTSRDWRSAALRARHQSVEAISISDNFLGDTRFGAVEWRPPFLDRLVIAP